MRFGAGYAGGDQAVGWIFGLVLLAEMVWVSMGVFIADGAVEASFGSVPRVAELLYTRFVYPFELTRCCFWRRSWARWLWPGKGWSDGAA